MTVRHFGIPVLQCRTHLYNSLCRYIFICYSSMKAGG